MTRRTATEVIRLRPTKATHPDATRPFLREPDELIQARRDKFEALIALQCSVKQAWAIAFKHHPRKYLTEAEAKLLEHKY